ncbi:MAG: hypothetical protein R3F39_24915 [Myxococcota bacterium]
MRAAILCAISCCALWTLGTPVASAQTPCATAADCNDGDPCTADACPPEVGSCVHDLVGWSAGAYTSARLTRTAGVGQERLGVSVAMDGDLAVTGALASPAKVANGGAAVLFRRTGTTWAQEAVLTGADTATNDAFGTSVAVSGGVVVIGAPLASPTASQAGAVYVFRKLGGTWTQTQRLVAPDAAALDWFGQAVAISGDTLVVGSPRDDDKGASSGSAYVYRWDGITWNMSQKLLAADGVKGDELGAAVAIDGEALVLGARFDDDPTAGPDAGSAYVFRRGAAGFVEEAKLLGGDAAQFDLFGSAVAIDGDRVVAGAPQANVGGISDVGAAWVFARSGGTWAEEGKLTSAGGGPLDKLGSAVAISGGTALIGAPLYGIQGASYGTAWFFEHQDDAWVRTRQYLVAGGTVNDEAGTAVALSGRFALVGADRDPTKGQNAGALHALVATPPVVCDDGNPCTADTCVPAGGTCAFAPKSGPCADGDPCTLDTTCEAGACVAVGAAGPCDDGNACTEDLCLGEAGCERTAIIADCDDQNACTEGDSCNAGVCSGISTPSCDDGDPCTVDSCDAALGCVAKAQAGGSCDDEDPCTVTDLCDAAGACAGKAKTCKTAPAPTCADANTRRTFAASGSCEAGTGTCVYAPTDTPCPFGCSGGVCATTTCQLAEAGAACDDGNPCTDNDACNGSGGCVGTVKDCSSLDGVCVTGVCTPATGKCAAATKANGTSCDDGSLCTTGERCQGGLCSGGTTVKCTDTDACTADSCDSKKGCINFVIEGCCSATRPCDNVEACVGGTCASRFCEPCTEDATCGVNGVCAQGTVGGFCTTRCSDGCGHATSCFTEIKAGDGSPVCGPDAGLPELPTRCDGDEVVTLVGCGDAGDDPQPCDNGCVDGACCPDGQHREGAQCVADGVEVVETVPDQNVEEAPDAGGEVDAGTDAGLDVEDDSTGAEVTPKPKDGGCSAGQSPSTFLWLGLALLGLAASRRRRAV